jgi:collagen type IV alpha
MIFNTLGQRGDNGFDGLDGQPGFVGEKGDLGTPGLTGKYGIRGRKGLSGDAGEPGYEGVPGIKGFKGVKGEAAPRNFQVPKPGYEGLRGEKGERGEFGDAGIPGRQGHRGLKGYQGLIGFQGNPGPQGAKGERGLPGPPGVRGLDGFRGPPGPDGEDAPPPPPPKTRGYIFARHSQTIAIPRCPANTQLLWQGYSFVSIIGSNRAVGQDLGASGSCLQRFTTMPFMFCNLNNVCSYAENNDDSIWLTTGEPMPMSMTPIPAREMEKYVSRCAVCESTTKLIALHSQSMEIPQCPNTWEEAWIGYSYYMQTSDASGNSHQSLVSPGSCLEEFRAQPVIECHGRGTCNIFDGITSFWLTVIEESDQFKKPKQQTLKADQTSKISRCTVCRKVERAFARARPASPFNNAEAFSRSETYAPPPSPPQPQRNYGPPPQQQPAPRRRRPNGSRVNAQRRLQQRRNSPPAQP